MESVMFMPKKRAREASSSNVFKSNGGQTVVMVNSEQDDDRERRRKVLLQRKQRVNTHFDFMEESTSVMNIMVVCKLACTLYLEPRTVLQYCSYWMSEYANRAITPDRWFGNLVKELLTTLPMLEISGQVGLRYTLDRSACYPLLLRFAGSELHRVPHAYFTAREGSSNETTNASLLGCLGYVIDPKNQCFLSNHTAGMMSEFFMESFVYNTLMEEFYEPSFLVLTCFMLYVKYINSSLLFNIVNKKKVTRENMKFLCNDLAHLKINLITQALEPIKLFVEASVDEANEEKDIRELDKKKLLNECGFLDRNDSDAEVKSMRMLMDLVQLILVAEANILDANKLQSEVNALWSEKMRYCCNEMSLRTDRILGGLLKEHHGGNM